MTDIHDILDQSHSLRQALPAALSLPSPEQIQEEITKRKRFGNTARDLKRSYRKMVTAYEQDMRDRTREYRAAQDATTKLIDATKEDIGTIDSELSWLATDIDDLEEAYWDRVHGRKDISKGSHATDPSVVDS